MGSEGEVFWPGVSIVVSCGLLRSGEESGTTAGWGVTSVVVGTSGEGAGVVGVEVESPPVAGSSSAGGTSLGTESFKFTGSFTVSEIIESVKGQSTSVPTRPQHYPGLRSQKKERKPGLTIR